MTRTRRLILIALAFELVLVVCDAKASNRGGDIDWVTDYETAYKLAQQQNKPVLVYVWTQQRYVTPEAHSGAETPVPTTMSGEIHPLSHEYTKGMWRSSKVTDEARRFVCLSVSIDSGEPFAQRCVQQRAQVFFTDTKGNVLGKFTGTQYLGVGLPRKVFEPAGILRAMRKVKWP